MSDSIENLVAAHLDAWNAPAGPDRERAITELYSAAVVIAEPDAKYHGYRGMTEAISNLQAQLPDARLSRTGQIERAQDLVTYTWSLGPRDEPPIATGRDVLIVRDGLITSLYVLIDGA